MDDTHLSQGNVGDHGLLEPEQKVYEPQPSPATPGTRKRRRSDGEHAGGRAKLTLKDKFDIITFFDQNLDQQNHALIARKYGVSRQSVRKVLLNREIVLQDYHNNVPQDAKRARTLSPDFVALDERVLEFLASIAAQSNPMLKRNVLPIGMDAVKTKATEIAALLNIKSNKVNSYSLSILLLFMSYAFWFYYSGKSHRDSLARHECLVCSLLQPP